MLGEPQCWWDDFTGPKIRAGLVPPALFDATHRHHKIDADRYEQRGVQDTVLATADELVPVKEQDRQCAGLLDAEFRHGAAADLSYYGTLPSKGGREGLVLELGSWSRRIDWNQGQPLKRQG
jgi:hypothetical protein